MIAAALLILLGADLTCGLLFAIPFALLGVTRVDPHATHGSWGLSAADPSGAMALWPLLLRRWVSGAGHPPRERSPHRLAAFDRAEAAARVGNKSAA